MDPPLRLSREQVRGIDRVCIEEYGIPGVILMENAARGLFDVAREMLVGNGAGRVLIVCGGGNNGDDGYALARHLHNAGFDVLLAVARPTGELAGDAATNAAICVKMGLPVEQATPQLIATAPADLVVDALFGTGLAQPPRSDAVVLICAMNERGLPILAVDLPSGLDCDTGRPLGDPKDCVRATRTATMVAEKTGFPTAKQWTGRVSVVGIGSPRAVIERIVLNVRGS